MWQYVGSHHSTCLLILSLTRMLFSAFLVVRVLCKPFFKKKESGVRKDDAGRCHVKQQRRQHLQQLAQETLCFVDDLAEV